MVGVMLYKEKIILKKLRSFFINFRRLNWLLVSILSLVLLPIECKSREEASQPHLTPETLNEARKLILNDSLSFKKRVELAVSMTGTLENNNLSQQARHLCLDFFASVVLHTEDSQLDKSSVFTEFAREIERGKRKSAMQKIHQYLDKNKSDNPPSLLSLLALKADDMFMAYYVLYKDIYDKKISPYSTYVLGILSAREKRFVEAVRYLEQVQGKLKLQLLERWLAIDLTKLAILNGEAEKADSILANLLEQNPNDIRALNLKIKFDLARNKKDQARQQLARIVPLLYEDPYLIAETASYAMQLNELNTAVNILEKFENKVEPNRDFYEALALVRLAQEKYDEAEKYQQKAQSVQDSRVVVGGMLPQNDELNKLIETARAKQRDQINQFKGLDQLAKVYLFLLSRDIKSAVEELENITEQPGQHPQELFLLASLYRRLGENSNTIKNLESLKQKYPNFRPYEILANLADEYVSTGQLDKAAESYRELQNHFPESYQAKVAQRFLANQEEKIKPAPKQSFNVSPFYSRYSQYFAPFIISEIMNFWGDRISFTKLNSRLGTSPRRGLRFDEFFSILMSGTRYEVLPFIGTPEVIEEFLKNNIPVIFCQGEMFSSQQLVNASLLAGSDPTRGLFYAESVTPSAPHLLTEPELLEGVCIAVYPGSLNPSLSEAAEKSSESGKEYMLLNAGAIMTKSRQKDYDPKEFKNRMETIKKEKARGFIPHQLAFARWTIQEESFSKGRAYLDAIKKLCTITSQFWYLTADLEFGNKNIDNALVALDRSLKMKPNTPRYELSLIRVLYMQGKIDEAIKKAEDLRYQFPDNSSVSAHLIALYKKAGETAKHQAEKARLRDFLHLDIEVDLDAQ